MRHLILCAALLASSVTVGSAEDGAFGDLVRKPTNSVCVFDGNPVDPSKQPVEVVASAKGDTALVGACSEACLSKLHHQLGTQAYEVAAAASSNTTLAKMAMAPPVSQLPPPPLANPPGFNATGANGPTTTTAAAPLAAPAPAKNDPKTIEAGPFDHNSTADVPPANGQPATAKADTKGDKKSSKSGKSEKSDTATHSDMRGDQSDDRQREKKKAQRKEMGKE